ncbi:suppressor of fused domain protein [Saccharothrix variisporea]|uniref:Suppressor of fused protein SUFU n=1 Tax=Saccharothrix variisporea TaxID=543527 RepID=A0A495X9W2_9PSEU|nr:suppressor of fused domain protein [Saccharothrix variisporea]RKT69403.1 suppressor of fused protein SUFU [Saccharothrix variisporea]
MRFGKRKHRDGSRDAVKRHLENHLGAVTSLSTIEVAGKATIDLHEHRDAPGTGQTTLVTNGLASFAREHAFAGEEGLAQELVMVLRTEYVTEAMLDFFARVADLYTSQHGLLDWGVPLKLGSPVPGSDDLSFLYPTPAAVFEESFQFVEQPNALTVFCLLVPLRDEEVDAVVRLGIEGFDEEMGRLDPDIGDLRRPGIPFRTG